MRSRLFVSMIALAAVNASCSLDPFDYRPLDAAVSPMDATTADVQDVVDATLPDVQPVDADVQSVDADVQSVDADAQPVDADVQAVDADAQPVDADVQAVDADVQAVDADAQAIDADVPAIDADVQSVDADVQSVDADVQPVDAPEAGACDDGGFVDDRPDAGVSRECPALPTCTTVVTASPTGGTGTDASPFTGWEAIPPGACRVEFPPGVYLVRQPITMRSNLTIQCMSSTAPVTFRRDRAMMTADGGVWASPIFGEPNGDTLQNVVIDGCTFDHEGQYVIPGDVMFPQASGRGTGDRVNLYVQNNHFINLDVTGDAVVELASGTTYGGSACLVVRNNEFLSPAFGTRASPASPGPAIRIYAGEHVLVQGNRTQNHFGVYIYDGVYESASPVRDIQVVDNVFDNVKNMALYFTTQANRFARVDGGCPAVPDSQLKGPFVSVRVDHNTITANLAAGNSIFAGVVQMGARYTGSGPCASTCNFVRPWRDLSVIGNSVQGAPLGFNFIPDNYGRGEPCVVAREAGVSVPYFARDVRVANNTFDGLDPRAGALPSRSGAPLQLIGMRNLEMRANHITRSPWGALVSGDTLQIVGNTFDALNQRGAFDGAASDGSLNILGARGAVFGQLLGESRDVTVSCNTFGAPATSSVGSLSAVLVDRGVSNVTLTRNAMSGARYDCAVDVAAERGDGGVPDGGSAVRESDTTRAPSTMPARCR